MDTETSRGRVIFKAVILVLSLFLGVEKICCTLIPTKVILRYNVCLYNNNVDI